MSKLVEEARHICGNIRPIPPEVFVSLVTEIERLEAENAQLLVERNKVVLLLSNSMAENARLQELLRYAWPFVRGVHQLAHSPELAEEIRSALEGKNE